jgi:hypothetical protein
MRVFMQACEDWYGGCECTDQAGRLERERGRAGANAAQAARPPSCHVQ